jgi:tape measure domain-containing protein
MSTVLGDVLVRYKGDVSDLSSKVKQAKSDIASVSETAKQSGNGIFSGFGNGIKGALSFGAQIGQTVIGMQGLAQGATGLASALLGPNASMEQTGVAFQTLLGKGKATQDFLGQLQQFAAATPFEFPELATDAQHMLAFGFSAKDVIPDLTNIGDAMGSMGKSNADIDHMVEIFGQMHAAGKLNAGDMMQISQEGIPAWKMLADSMGKTVPEVQKLSSQGLIPADKAIKAVSDGMHKMFGGGMAAQAQTFNGQLSTVKDNASAALRSFTGPLFESAKGGLQKLGDLVSSKAFQDFATQAGKQIGQVLGQIGTVLQTNVIPAFQKMIEIGTNIVNFFKQNEVAMAALKGVLVGVSVVIAIALVSAFISWAIAAGAAAIATLAATWPILAIGAIIALVVTGIILAVHHWGDIMNWLKAVIGAVAAWVGGVFSGLGSFLHGIIDKIGSAFSGFGTLMHSIWNGVVGVVKGAINNIIGAINGFIGFIDGIQIHIPSIGVGPVHTPAFDWNGLGLPRLAYLAQGGYAQGWFVAGEQGPELGYAGAGGVQMYSNSQSKAMGYPIRASAGGSVVVAGGNAGGSGSRQPAHFHLEINGREFAAAMIDDIGNAQDRHVRLKLGANGRAA